MTDTITLAPSLLAGKQDALGESLKLAESAKVKWLHLDIMDGHFVPNISFGPKALTDLRAQSELYFDVHLMLSNPDAHIESFINAGADSITIHCEPNYPIEDTLSLIRARGIKSGIALNPETDIEAILPYLRFVDLVLVMTVNPGFGGQSFIPCCLEKVSQLKNLKEHENYNYKIEVDGGVTLENAAECLQSGADILVCGTAFYKSRNPQQFHQDILDIKLG